MHMTNGTSQGLFIVVAIVIFGIFTSMAYILFEDTLSPALATIFGDATDDSHLKLANKKENPGFFNDVVEITDDNLKQQIIWELGYTLVDDEGTYTPEEKKEIELGLDITKKDLEKLTELDISHSEIISLKGLEAAKNLSKLDANTNNLTTIKEVTKLKELTYLDVSNNPNLTDIEGISNLGDLNHLNLGSTALTDMSKQEIVDLLVGNKNLDTFTLVDTKMSDETLLELQDASITIENVTIDLPYPEATGWLHFEYLKTESGVTITKYKGTENDVVIPQFAVLDDGTKLPVIAIGDNAFMDAIKIKSIRFPNTLTSIGNNAFLGQSNLTGELIIPKSVTYIGKYAFDMSNYSKITFQNSPAKIDYAAFYRNYLLQEIDFGNAVYDIGASSFSNVFGGVNRNNLLKSVTIPDSVNIIGDHAFSGNSGLLDVYIGDVSRDVFARDVHLVANSNPRINAKQPYMYTQDGTITNYRGSETNVTIPNSINGVTITKIGDYAFSKTGNNIIRTNLEHVTFPNTLKEIGNSAFISQTGLTGDIIFPKSLVYIGKSAFDMNNILGVSFEDSPATLDYAAFYRNYNLEKINLGNAMVSLEASAFSNHFEGIGRNNKLNSVTLPDSLKTVKEGAFWGNKALKDVHIGDANRKVLSETPTNVFASNPKVHYRQPYIYTDTGSITDYWGYETNLKIPANINGTTITKIAPYAFNSSGGTNSINVALISVEFPNTLEEIGNYAFSTQYSLTGKVVFPKSLNKIGEYAFEQTNLLEIYFEDSPTNIGYAAFYRNYNLSKIDFGEGLKSIGVSAFSNLYSGSSHNSKLLEVSLPKSLDSIGIGSFSGNSALKRVLSTKDTFDRILSGKTSSVFSSNPTFLEGY